MCHFFSFLSDAQGNFYYADWELRQSILRGEVKDAEPDSHSWLAKHFLKNAAEDKLNKYEYNPLAKVFNVDQINTDDDRVSAEKWVREVKWSRIVKPLTIKKIKHPLLGNAKTLTPSDKKLVKEWASVCDSVGASVRASVGASVCDSVRASVCDSVGASVRASVWASVRASVGTSVGDSVWASVGASVCDSVWASVVASVCDSVCDSVWASVRASVCDSVGAYCGSFIDIEYKVNISPSNKLWERGFVVSFDGATYRVHSGKQSKIVWEYKP